MVGVTPHSSISPLTTGPVAGWIGRLLAAGSPSRRLDRCERLARALYEARPDLRREFPDPASDDYWAWFNRFGYAEVPAARQLLLPVPPRDRRGAVGDPDELSFLASGASSYRLLMRVARETRGSLAGFGEVLDFGCGVGRTLRYLFRHSRVTRLHGSDVDADAIAWSRRHLPFARFASHGRKPPLPYPDAAFDLVYAIGVFTHMTEASQTAWLDELARALRPGGIALLTAHGRIAIDALRGNVDLLESLDLSPAHLDVASRELDARGFSFLRQPGLYVERQPVGISLLDPTYVREHWQQNFELVSFEAGALDGWHDAVVLRRR